jgi:hypothetical protein
MDMATVEELVLDKSEIDSRYNATEEITRVGTSLAHKHPKSEYIEVLRGCVIVAYLENGAINTQKSTRGVFIEGNVPHRVFIDGSVTVYTSKKNLANLDRRERLTDFI